MSQPTKGEFERWQEARQLLERLYKRDSPWASDWQIDEAISKQAALYNAEEGNPFFGGKSREEVLDRAIKTLKFALEPSDKIAFGDWLRAELASRNLNQSQFALAIGAYPSAVSKWINNKQRPRPEQCERIMLALQVPFDEVMRAAGYPSPSRQWVVDDWIVESDIRQEITSLLHHIPERLLVPLVPMLQGLASADDEAIEQLNRRVGQPMSMNLDSEEGDHTS